MSGSGLRNLPVTVFSVGMGLAGTAAAWTTAAAEGFVSPVVGSLLVWVAAGVYTVVALAYGLKVVRHWPVVAAEWHDPLRIAFVPTSTIPLLLLSIAFLEAYPDVSRVLWWIGATGQFLITVDVLRVWISDERFTPQHVHPAWFLPVIGNLVAPLAGVVHAPVDVSWLFVAVGTTYWLALLAVVLNRLFFGGALPDELSPTLAILLAPPALAYLSWFALTGEAGHPVARFLLGLVLFQLALLLVQAPKLARVPFALSAWAYVFPFAAASVALLTAAEQGMGPMYLWTGLSGLCVLSVLVLALTVRTGLAFRRGEVLRSG